MGSSHSKVKVFVPNRVPCFPSYTEESIQETIQKISECHLQAVQIASWIGSALGPKTSCNHLVFTAATVLFTFLLHQTSSSVGSDEKSLSKCTGSVESKSLEDALIEAKVSAAIANKSVCELQAKLSIIKNRHDRLLSKISPEDRRLEVVPAIQTCEEVLRLFQDPNHVFRKNPLTSAPFLVPFAAIFVMIAEFSATLIPSYINPLVKEMDLLIDTLQNYKNACVKARLESVKLKCVPPATMLDAVANGMNEISYRMEDTCSQAAPRKTGGSEGTKGKHDEMERIYEDANLAVSIFREDLEKEYENYFNPVLETVSKFSGYFHDADEEAGCSYSRKCCDDDDDD